ncbi:class I SAM-dependent methyltransferase [Euzebya tangerina]|uniref:class I SAM-dependent methyltransferase n=1 Tax=Euzebya tangerina TaxID=591198 RepID=UPI000E30F2CA|nr:class I SAM-dependent methyltransferase [Euzebya tangerina]
MPAEHIPAIDVPAPFHNGRRGRWNAWFFATFDRYINVILRRHKSRAFAGIAPGDVLELGPGVGANFAFIPSGSRVLAVEPNRAMHPRLIARAEDHGLDLELLEVGAEVLPLPDNSVGEVICSLVLCTVEQPERVLAEIRRVLRPGGRFRFVEHVAAAPVSPRRWLQEALTRPWAWVFEGCRLCRDTGRVIQDAGFARVEITRRRPAWSVFVPVNSMIYGVATT